MTLSSRSTPGSGTNFSTGKPSTPSQRRRSSRAGDAITRPCGRMDRWATSRRRPKSSYQPWPRGRLRNPSSFATRYGLKAINALTVQLDHSLGAGHHGPENRSLPNPHQSSYPSLCRPLHLVAANSTMLAHPNAVLGARQPSHLFKRPIRFSSSSRLTSLKQVIDYK